VFVVAAAVAAVLLLADQTSKSYIVSNYLPGQFVVGNSYLSLVFVTNPGGICGYAQGAGTLLTVVGVATSLFIVVSIFTIMPDSLIHAAAFGSLFAGAVGNLIDRLRFGYVVDFITLDFLNWPSFNLADASIIGGVALVGFLTLFGTAHGDTGEKSAESSRPEIGRNSIFFLVVAGLAFAVAYLFCVFRPFG
jgi:signal peptidase II